MLRGIIFGIVFGIVTLGSADSATIYVPDDYPTIQDAIDASLDGDTIIVRPGTYVENINYMGKTITVMSEKGPHVTTIDGGIPSNPNRGSVVYIESGEGPDTVLEGFTITNGTGTNGVGGGILCNTSSPTIRNNIITGNRLHGHGGGVYSYLSTVTIEDTLVIGNTLTNGYNGAGIHSYASTLAVIDTIVAGNTSGIFSSGKGGGIYAHSSTVTLTNTNLFWNNAEAGGGFYCTYNPKAVVTNCIFFDNEDNAKAGGLYVGGYSDATVHNTIFWDNGPWYGGYWEIYLNSGTFTISYSDVDMGQNGVYVSGSSTMNWGSGMIEADPQLHDPDKGDLHLTSEPRTRYSENASD